jgi:hypothetical protein
MWPHKAQRHHGMVVSLVNPLGTMDAHAAVEDGVLVDLSLWGTSIIGLAVQCPLVSGITATRLVILERKAKMPMQAINGDYP